MKPRDVKELVSEIVRSGQKGTEEKVFELTRLHHQLSGEDEQTVLLVDGGIEDVFGQELRRLNAIRERNLETVSMADIEELKQGFALLFSLIDETLDWNPERKSSLEGVINRASLRAMLIDPAVSIKTKDEIMRNWEEFM